jgi:hypothetical protein
MIKLTGALEDDEETCRGAVYASCRLEDAEPSIGAGYEICGRDMVND